MSINRRAFLGWAGVGGAASSLWMAFAKQPLPVRTASVALFSPKAPEESEQGYYQTQRSNGSQGI